MIDKKECAQYTHKMNRIAGQVSGIAKMIDNRRDVTEIVTQISAVRSSLSSLAVEMLKDESSDCLNKKGKKDKIERFNELVTQFFKIA